MLPILVGGLKKDVAWPGKSRTAPGRTGHEVDDNFRGRGLVISFFSVANSIASRWLTITNEDVAFICADPRDDFDWFAVGRERTEYV